MTRSLFHKLAALFGLLLYAVHIPALEIEVESGTTLSIERFGQGERRILLLPSEYGMQGEGERQLAAAIADNGIEVWLVDLHGSYFMPPGRSSLDDIPREDIRELMTTAHSDTSQLFLLSYGRGAALTLEAARLWQLQRSGNDKPLGGAVLLHPNLMAGSARAGEEASLLPITDAVNLPLFILQPLNSAKRWYQQELVERLQRGGSDIYYRTLPNVSDGFQVREDANEYELEVREKVPEMVHSALSLLGSYNRKPRLPVVELQESRVSERRVFSGLLAIEEKPFSPPLELADLDGRKWDLRELRGEVVLLNFWATWCPPCVEEIPSLGRLNKRLVGKPFRLVSIDVGEEVAQVREFLQQVPAEFPVLLDPDGTTTQAWKLRAFPTSFVVDRQGRLRYGYYGALEWDGDEVVGLIEALLQE